MIGKRNGIETFPDEIELTLKVKSEAPRRMRGGLLYSNADHKRKWRVTTRVPKRRGWNNQLWQELGGE